MRKLSPTEETITFRLRMPASMRRYLDKQKGGASAWVRKLIEQRMGCGK